jgi:hypothetical protein
MTAPGDIIHIPGTDPKLPWIAALVIEVTPITIWADEKIPGTKQVRTVESGYTAVKVVPV